jgi:hypothetical protein
VDVLQNRVHHSDSVYNEVTEDVVVVIEVMLVRCLNFVLV